MRRWLEGVIAGRQKGFVASCYRGLMTVPSWFYAIFLHIRHALYTLGLKRATWFDVPVVSVGNIVVGGSGKTQLILLLADELKEKRIAILTRGYPVYRGKPMRVLKTTPATLCGDEPKLLAKRLPDAIVIVGRDRIKGAKLAIELGAELILLDDGMQHRRLGRDIEIGLGSREGDFLPKGRLRDLPKRMEKADLVLGPSDLRCRPAGLFSENGKGVDVPKKVALFCGIGNPEGFVETVKEMGCDIVKTQFLADHEKMGIKELKKLATGVDMVVCTEKDQVKLEGIDASFGWVKSEMHVINNHDAWETTLEQIRSL
ncbi:MAG: Tetraacyldisaccharide 4'-kinase [Chlamydiales bacterium]|nr:Tetraacyldisaccharide 4'-kinase [Chlamydiales bacterium]MCH9619241.1 Tetraacyldisaccharide 4'-kinase [Chlamydiales bacterium]MCH9622503.1 Tetraacyldisaccharide 4'-kinase [Chlamydiales bacterium]